MRKTILGVLWMIAICLLCACNNKESSNEIDEMDIINENLRLKDKVVELEGELNEKIQQIEVEREILLTVNSFFQAINLGDVKEAMSFVTERINVKAESLLLPNNRQLKVGQREFFKLALLETDWEQNNRVCLTFNQFSKDSQLRMNVYVVKSASDWKIDNMGLDLDG